MSLAQKTNMSLDSTPQPFRPRLDELVPSRYALKVGDIDVLVISDGVLHLPTNVLVATADPAARQAVIDQLMLPPEMLDWPLNVVVLQSGDRTILVDTGAGVNSNLPKAGQLTHRLEAAGIDLADLTDVVLTHLHMDHVGGLLVDGVKEQLRPDLRIHVAAAEVKFWAQPDFSLVSMPEGFPEVLESTAQKFLRKYRSYLRTFEDRAEIAPGVVAQRTGGHTPGHCVVRLNSGGERPTFAGDAVFQVGFDHPDLHNGFEHDPMEAARVRVRLLREMAESGELLLATHLSFPSICHVKVDGDVFRCMPVNWDY
jgi:glyoxylase-like metal-dependent hydrolase (beta-lactamase superfamily II)